MKSSDSQTMPVGHRNTADERADDAQIALIGTTQVEVLHVGCSVEPLLGRAVNCTVLVAGEATNCRWGKHVGIDHAVAKIRHKSHGRGRKPIIPAELF